MTRKEEEKEDDMLTQHESIMKDKNANLTITQK